MQRAAPLRGNKLLAPLGRDQHGRKQPAPRAEQRLELVDLMGRLKERERELVALLVEPSQRLL